MLRNYKISDNKKILFSIVVFFKSNLILRFFFYIQGVFPREHSVYKILV